MSEEDSFDDNEESSYQNDINEKNDENSSSLDDLKVAWREGKDMREEATRNCNTQIMLDSVKNKETSLWRRLLKMGRDGPEFYRKTISEWKKNGNKPTVAEKIVDLTEKDTIDYFETDILPSPLKFKKPFADIQYVELMPSLAINITETILRNRAMQLLYEGLGNLQVCIKIEEELYRQYREDVDSYTEFILQISACTGNEIFYIYLWLYFNKIMIHNS